MPAMIRPTIIGAGPRSSDVQRLARVGEAPATSTPMMTSGMDQRESGCQRGSGATSNWTSTSSDRIARSSRRRLSPTRRRSTTWRRTGRAFGEGWLEASAATSIAHLDGLAVALVALLRRVAFGDEALGLAGLLEEGAALGERGLGLGPPLAGGRQAVAVAFELGEGEVALFDARPRTGPRPAPRPSAAPDSCRPSSSGRGRPCRACGGRGWCPRSAPLMRPGAGRAGRPRRARARRAPWWRIDPVDRKKPSVGIPVSSAMTWSASAGSEMACPSYGGRPCPSRRRTSSRACPSRRRPPRPGRNRSPRPSARPRRHPTA